MARRVAVMFSEQELVAAARQAWHENLVELLEDLLDEIQSKREVDQRAHEILEPRTTVRRSQP